MVESVRYTAKLRGAGDWPFRLATSYPLAPVDRSDAGEGHEATSLQSAICETNVRTNVGRKAGARAQGAYGVGASGLGEV